MVNEDVYILLALHGSSSRISLHFLFLAFSAFSFLAFSIFFCIFSAPILLAGNIVPDFFLQVR